MRNAQENSAGLMNTTAVEMLDTKVTSKLNLLNAFNSTTTNHSGVISFKKLFPKLATVMFVALITLVFTACSKDDNNPVGASAPLPGTSWRYVENTNDYIMLNFQTETSGLLTVVYENGKSISAGAFTYVYNSPNVNIQVPGTNISYSGSISGNKMTLTQYVGSDSAPGLVFNKL